MLFNTGGQQPSFGTGFNTNNTQPFAQQQQQQTPIFGQQAQPTFGTGQTFGQQQNQPFGQQAPLFGQGVLQQTPAFGQGAQQQSFGQQAPAFGQQPLAFGQQNQQTPYGQQMNQQSMFQQAFNQSQQNQFQNSLLPNNQISEQFSSTQLKQRIKEVYMHLSNSNLNLIQLVIDNNQQQVLKQMQDCTLTQQINQMQDQDLKSVRERCLALKNTNEKILCQMFNIKQKMSRAFSASIDKDYQSEQQFKIVQDKIRRVKNEIKNKLSYLKDKGILENSINAKSKKQHDYRFTPINVALTELKDATEVIDRQLIKQREEIRTLIKHLYGQDI